MKVCFETFGCRLNRAEALQLEAEYLAKGWLLTEKHAEADLFVVGACSVTRRAQHDTEQLITHLKKHYPNKPIIIKGCLPKVSRKVLLDTSAKSNPTVTSDANIVPTRTARAYLKVQDGCNGACTFCMVPQFRGKSSSIPFEEVLAKAQRFIENGYHEIVVTGCNLALYASNGKRLPELIDALARLSGDCRIRIGSIEPSPLAMEMVEVMAAHANICRFLHLPVQSGSNRILKSMRRPYIVSDIDALVKKAIAAMPLIGLGCDIMTGFPGETDIDFISTLGMIKRHKYSNIHVFPYSERPGTVAATLSDAIPHELRHARAHEVADLSRRFKSSAANAFLGKDVEVVIEDEKKLSGWSGEYFAVEITNKTCATSLKRKSLVKVHVMDNHHGHLKGTLV